MSTTPPDDRAAEAERSVSVLFAGRLGRMPWTHLARVVHPAPAASRPFGWLGGEWHYWWQAHYLDAIVDAGLRATRTGDVAAAERLARQGDRLLLTIRLRNRGRWVNHFYDDMAWLALASGRLAALHDELGHTRTRRLRSAARHLTEQLRSAHTGDAGGGLFWSSDRDFKNSPATGPAALHFARIGETDEARRLVDWVYARLWSEDSGLVLDGIRLRDGGEVLVNDVWSYNQGTVLGALVTLGDDRSLERAAALVAAVDARLTAELEGVRVLRTHGGGDGGLFTGILVRYLALAASSQRVDDVARGTARRLVLATGDALWQGRESYPVAGRRDPSVFPPEPGGPPPAAPLELSPQLQAWTVLEAAATLA